MAKQKSPALAEGDLGGGLLKNSQPCHSERSEESTLAKLEKEFAQNGGQWREFLMGRLFEKVEYTKLNLKKQILPKEQKGEYNLPAITCTTQNNGISCYVPRDNATIFKNCISVAANGDAPAFYQPHDFTILQDAYVLKFKDKELSHLHYLYLVALLQKVLAKFDWTNKSGWEKVKLEKITLPMDSNGEIAFDFMQSYIAELEAERIAELEAYLQVTGLKDYELNEDEKAALKAFESLENSQNSHHENLKWREFKIGELFSVKSNPQLNKDSFNFSESGEYPYFTRTCLNNGISGYVDYLDDEHKIKGKSIAVGMLGMQFFYMEKDFYAGQFTKTIYPKFEPFNPKIAHYFITLFNKHQKALQAMLVRDFEKTFLATKLHLPTKNGEIDFDFMRVFIKAVEKEVIKGVVLWSEKRLNATKQIISKP